MLTIVMPATSFALTTKARAAPLLGVAEDDKLGKRIDQASRVIASYCRRPFGMETVKQSGGGDALCGIAFARTPVRIIHSVSIGDVDVDPEEYAIDEATGSLMRIGADDAVLSWWTAPTILYDAGYTLPTDEAPGDLPDDVERAAIELVAIYLNAAERDAMIKSEDVDGVGSVSYFMPGAADLLPYPEIAQLLAPYRRFWP